MQKIALEEHYSAPDFKKYEATLGGEISEEALKKATERLPEFNELRLQAMDEAGVQISVLSQTSPGVQVEPNPEVAIKKASIANDFLFKQIQLNPTRYRGFAHLSMHNPKAATAELTRCVKELGFLGAMINGHTLGIYLDAPEYEEFWQCVSELNVPIYLHPVNFYGMPYMLHDRPELLGPIWGWGIETATHALRLVVSGLFDRLPNLKIILGHMGETLPFALWRLDTRYNEHGIVKTKLLLKPSEYIKRNIVITTAGVCDPIPLRCSIDALGVDNILFSVDYPYEVSRIAGQFIENAPISIDEKEKICFKNAERILKLSLKLNG